MSAALVVEPTNPVDTDRVTLRLQEQLNWIDELLFAPVESDADPQRIDRIALCERLQAALEALKARETVEFARSQAAEQIRSGVHPRAVGRGIADQIALACRTSPSEGSRRLRMSRDLVLDMPATFRRLARGEISGWATRLITEQTSHLDRCTRRQVDASLANKRPETMSPREAATVAKRLAYEADPEAAMARARTARADRRVTLRPAPDTMSLLTGLLPVEQGVACLAALKTEVTQRRASGDERSEGQIMADTLVQRLTGQASADDLVVEVSIVMPVESLLDPDAPAPSELADLGPIPAPLAQEILSSTMARSWWRRLFTKPNRTGSRVVVDLDERRRRFTGWLAELIRMRDRHCRDPYCDAPVRHVDHIERFTNGGSTDAVNGRGVCARGNYVREMPGWSVTVLDAEAHTVVTTTPTGHRYLSAPPEP